MKCSIIPAGENSGSPFWCTEGLRAFFRHLFAAIGLFRIGTDAGVADEGVHGPGGFVLGAKKGMPAFLKRSRAGPTATRGSCWRRWVCCISWQGGDNFRGVHQFADRGGERSWNSNMKGIIIQTPSMLSWLMRISRSGVGHGPDVGSRCPPGSGARGKGLEDLLDLVRGRRVQLRDIQPQATQASAMVTQYPPPPEMMATRFPLGRAGWTGPWPCQRYAGDITADQPGLSAESFEDLVVAGQGCSVR